MERGFNRRICLLLSIYQRGVLLACGNFRKRRAGLRLSVFYFLLLHGGNLHLVFRDLEVHFRNVRQEEGIERKGLYPAHSGSAASSHPSWRCHIS
jgi:hypothetical protein